ncbi:hypothetical protein [Sagittula sp. MA-2]|uniref:hypothetical protein n=1 Tax=Sagittula sp. MA-2 TaxID=3048007 RepID=UPI0024C2F2F0|nr:hypothetical protein [Sagittula sp. MA-2]WHZ35722.1 hypothetical protein QNI11_01660 [Sagittula sp. MA-2]
MANWPTATGKDADGARTFSLEVKRLRANAGPTLTDLTGIWATPVANDDNKTPEAHMAMKARMKGGPRNTVTSLQVQAIMWTTPQAHDQRARGAGQTSGATGTNAGNRCLATDAMNWPTATTRDHKGSSATSLTRKDGKTRLDMLDFAAEQGFSHPDPATSTHGRLHSDQTRLARLLYRAAMPKPPRSISRAWCRPTRRPASCSAQQAYRLRTSYERWRQKRLTWWTRRRLSPAFVEWLMGWPSGHALCASSATEWHHWQRLMRGALSALPTASAGWIWDPPAKEPAETERPPAQLDLFGGV